MASADLDYIRALLIAQTAEPEPEARGVFGRLFASRRERRPAPPAPQPRPRFIPAESAESTDTGQELLLEQIIGPPLEIETASPLPPPPVRNGFGRRPDTATESELTLDQPAGEPRRLQVLDTDGQAIGEMILHPEVPSVHLISTARDEAHAVPFFPEDLMEPRASGEPQPMRPWIKALRNSGAPRLDGEAGAAEIAEPSPLPVNTRRAGKKNGKIKRELEAAGSLPTPHPAAPGLARDLLEALALTLTREQETVADRLMAAFSQALFQPETAVLTA